MVPAVTLVLHATELAREGQKEDERTRIDPAYGATAFVRQFASWCCARSLGLSAVRRAGIESFARDLEAKGRARATVTRRLCTIAGFYKYAVEEELLEHSPAAHVRRPRVDCESTPSRWTATSSARCWSRRGSGRRPSMR